MTTRRLILLFAACFCVTTLLTLPLQVVVGAAGLERIGVAIEQTQGSLRQIRLLGVSWRGQRIGDITLRPSWASVLTLRAAMAVTVDDGPVSGRGSLSWGPWAGLSLTDALIVADLRAMPSLLALSGRIEADVGHLAFGPGGCVNADARLKTDALRRGLAGLPWTGPMLEGQARCDARNLVLPLSGREGDQVFMAQMTMRPDDTFDVRINVENPDAAMAQVLPGIGFRPDGAVWMLTQTGRWKSG